MPPPPELWTIHADGEVLLRLSRHGVGHETPITIPELFRESVSRFGTYPALISKSCENWEILNFNQYYEACRKAARALIKLGLKRFHGVGILGFNSAEWSIASVGAILAGGISVGIYATNSAEACQYVIAGAKVNILLVENDLQLQKILSIPQSSMETLKAIIQYKLPIHEHDKENLYSWDDFMELGNSIPNSQLDQIIAEQKANQCAVLMYTSGTTGNPKGVMLSHDNITWTAGVVARDLGLSHAREKQEVVVSYLPLSHIAAQMLDIWVHMKIGSAIYFAQPDALKGTLIDTLREVKPTIFLGVPRIWEKMQERINENGTRSSQLKKKVFSWARAVGSKMNKKKMLGIHETPVSYHLAKVLVFSKVRNFLSLDLPVGEIYGLSESSGPHTVSKRENYKILSCGKILSGCKNLLYQQNTDGIGEVCIWGRHVFMGYLEKEQETMEVIDEDGWLHTGDLGHMDSQGYLFISGRIKEIIITASGENVSPVPIENMVKKKIPIVSHAMLVGDKAKFLSVLLTLKCEVDVVSGEPLDKLSPEAIKFCRSVGSQATTVTEIVKQHDFRVYAAIQKGIDAANQEANSGVHRVQKWAILEKDFSVRGGELGPTTKLRRYFVTQKYRNANVLPFVEKLRL
uniref:Long-chain-fatty-acid--CoA ligase ACSBG2 n=1 Tax=Rousettus aegyptiacus TaxID=9407 RepID=A0A7J8BPJ6_ROUAE|nr:acyl-CoA synthetase bubblegum family member 2 [Rousettus aegyptiacus]